MNIDDFLKSLLVASLCFSLVGISYQIMKLISNLGDSVGDFRKTIKNVSNMSEKVNRDYDFVMDQIKSFAESIGSIGRNVIDPITNMLGFLKRFEPSKSKLEKTNS